jgi:hypothetical protein
MTALAATVPFRRPRLVGAEILKLRKRRGLVITSFVLTVGVMAVVYGILVILHASNSAKHGPAGGVDNLGHTLGVLTALGGVAAILVGTAAGAGDLGAGVFKELVVTGRARRALFTARIPGGLAFLLPIVAVGYAVTAAASVVFAGSLPAPSTRLLVDSGAWVLLVVSFWFVLALGLASLLGSRSTTIGVLVALQLAIAPLVTGIHFLGAARDGIPGAALGRFAPDAVSHNAVSGVVPPMSVAAAVVAIAVTVTVALGAGAWRTITRDA